ncbi:unnamed protein product [Rangifer tarandus platyrhynchus]|uniref:Uncharacterized protein n=2 Tax=Rangifer tarandus platyrhynchus TaxID=3082113 RepID=A0ACB0EVU3_RANTA|nr:unnamed protein product [Rangifer tarandus platyrhynchus]CAI9704858.1 unnamed protein product [Rangifer tarandus platyrhynchus]
MVHGYRKRGGASAGRTWPGAAEGVRQATRTRAGCPAGPPPRAFTPRNPAAAPPIPSATAGTPGEAGRLCYCRSEERSQTIHARVTRPHPGRALSEVTSASPRTQHTLLVHCLSGTLLQVGVSPGGVQARFCFLRA